MSQGHDVGTTAAYLAYRKARERLPGSHAQPVRDREELLFDHWAEADLLLEARIGSMRMWAGNERAGAAKPVLDRCLASLKEVRDCLGSLRSVVKVASLTRPIRIDSPLALYMTQAYVWAGDVFEDVFARVQQLRGARPANDSVPDDSATYVAEFLEPLLLQVGDYHEELRADPALEPVLPLLIRLRRAILAVEWSLRTDT